jgi:hypothetical protein
LLLTRISLLHGTLPQPFDKNKGLCTKILLFYEILLIENNIFDTPCKKDYIFAGEAMPLMLFNIDCDKHHKQRHAAYV